MKTYEKQAILAKIAVSLNILNFSFLIFVTFGLFILKTGNEQEKGLVAFVVTLYLTILSLYIFEIILSLVAAFKIKFTRQFAYLFLLFGLGHIVVALLFMNIVYPPFQTFYMIFVGILYLITGITTLIVKQAKATTYTLHSKNNKTLSSILNDYNKNENQLTNHKNDDN